MTLWEDLLVLRAKWEERTTSLEAIAKNEIDDEVIATLREVHQEIDAIIKMHTRSKVPYQEK